MLIKNISIKPWNNYFKAFLVFFSFAQGLEAQNILSKQLNAGTIKEIVVNGNQIFNIRIETDKTDKIYITSKLDGEYQNHYQIKVLEDNNKLRLSLDLLPFNKIPDDKRNAHKVIAATLVIKVPEYITLNIFSDIGSVEASGNFNTLYVELLQGQCKVNGITKKAILNTIDGDIDVITKNAKVKASSNKGKVVVDKFTLEQAVWQLKSIHGNITVVNQE